METVPVEPLARQVQWRREENAIVPYNAALLRHVVQAVQGRMQVRDELLRGQCGQEILRIGTKIARNRRALPDSDLNRANVGIRGRDRRSDESEQDSRSQ